MLAFLWAWMRRHPRIVDAGVAALFLLPNVLTGRVYPIEQAVGGWPLAYVFMVAMCIPLVWRRRWPVAVFAVLATVAFLQWAANHYLTLADAALWCAAYTVAANSSRAYTALTFLTMELGALLVVLRWAGAFPDGAVTFVWMTVCTLTTMVFGDSVRSRRAYYAELEARARRLEHEREQEAQLAVAEERARIARDMHDVVAHNVSVMVVQAEGAAYLMDTDPQRSRTAVQTVATTGRQALAEMRRLLGVLRSGDAPADERAPQPSIADLPDLVARVVAAGHPVDLQLCTATEGVDAGVGLTAYRAVQERR
ncbi:MAG: sensor histidine kinase [Streptosporangiales bacterium]|nr:sensor histidine kinase [Streptosporangiales bacterium]